MTCNTVNRRRPVQRTNGLVAPVFGSMLQDLFQTPMSEVVERATITRRPAVNVSKSDDAFTLSFAVPGISKEDISVHVDGRLLTVSHSGAATEGNYSLREFDYAGFKRSFTLPKNVAADQIAASYDAGLLAVTLPIAPEAKPKTIEIS